MWLCRFATTKNNKWRCTDIYQASEEPIVLEQTRIAWLNCKTKPPIGFCKRPHKYM